jgi:hypothetical protein
VTDNAKKQQTPAKPYKERIDPGGEFGKQTAGLAALAASPMGRVLRWLGVDQATLDQTKELEETYRRLTEEPDRVSAALAPLGWIFFELAPFDDYVAAAALVEQGKVEEAEEPSTTTHAVVDGPPFCRNGGTASPGWTRRTAGGPSSSRSPGLGRSAWPLILADRYPGRRADRSHVLVSGRSREVAQGA